MNGDLPVVTVGTHLLDNAGTEAGVQHVVTDSVAKIGLRRRLGFPQPGRNPASGLLAARLPALGGAVVVARGIGPLLRGTGQLRFVELAVLAGFAGAAIRTPVTRRRPPRAAEPLSVI